jgi:hypothetical protein
VKNSTTIKLPNKYHKMVREIYFDEDGYWAMSEYGFKFVDSQCHTAHEDKQNDLLRVIRSAVPCDCQECTEHTKPA